MTVRTLCLRDGTRLHLEEHGDRAAPVTVVLVHGWTLDSRTWRHQVEHLPARCGRPVRVLAYDHRGHGRSGPVLADLATVAQVADDLAEVLARAAPAGPVVLAGHSLGGMAIMALAERHPEVFDDRVAAAALVATSAGGLARITLNLPLALAPLRAPLEAMFHRRMLARGERQTRVPPGMIHLAVRWLAFGRPTQPAHVRAAAQMIAGCSPYTIAAFRRTLDEHDRMAVLPRLAGRPVLVCGGARDRLTPVAHSHRIAAAIHGAELVVYDGVGHMIPMERAEDLTDRLAALVHAAVAARQQTPGSAAVPPGRPATPAVE
jgi:pimeloyl-ACP methyl ester carboxylesterase